MAGSTDEDEEGTAFELPSLAGAIASRSVANVAGRGKAAWRVRLIGR